VPRNNTKTRDDAAVFGALKRILEPYANGNRVVHNKPGYYYLETVEPINRGRPLFLAAVKRGKAYVSFHLMPVYGSQELLAAISPELKRRMQGKACFNFKTVDEKLFAELAKLTRRGIPALIREVSNKAPSSGSSPAPRRAAASTPDSLPAHQSRRRSLHSRFARSSANTGRPR